VVAVVSVDYVYVATDAVLRFLSQCDRRHKHSCGGEID
jgi:hypothetical protein